MRLASSLVLLLVVGCSANDPTLVPLSDAGATGSEAGDAGPAPDGALPPADAGGEASTDASDAGSSEPKPSGKILFDMRAGGAQDLQAVATFGQLAGLFKATGGGLYNGNGTFALEPDYDGKGKKAVRIDWPSNPGTESTATAIIYHASVPNLGVSFVRHLGRTASGGGIGAVGAYNSSVGDVGAKVMLHLRKPDDGAGRMYWYQARGGGPTNNTWAIDSDDFARQFTADHGEGVDVRWTYVIRPVDGTIKVWRNGVLVMDYTGGGFRSEPFAESQWVATRWSVGQPETEYWTDFVLWGP
jgi:hypothetical protein